MANESRAFHIINGVNLDDIVKSVTSFLNIEKHMEVQSSPTSEGYILQASQPKDAWKTLSGTRLAITVNFVLSGDVLNVMVGEGNWSDKLGAGAVGLFIAWPLAISAGFGAFRQKRLPTEIFAVIEKAIYTGGQQVLINSAGSKVGSDQVVCPKCKAINPETSKFCNKCGAPISNNCPNCGAKLVNGAKFCNQCGKQL